MEDQNLLTKIEETEETLCFDDCSLKCMEVMEVTFGVKWTAHYFIISAFNYFWRYRHGGDRTNLMIAHRYLEYLDNYQFNDQRRMHKMQDRLKYLLEHIENDEEK